MNPNLLPPLPTRPVRPPTTKQHNEHDEGWWTMGRARLYGSALLLIFLLVFATLVIKLLQRQGYVGLEQNPKSMLIAYFAPYTKMYRPPGCWWSSTPHPLIPTSETVLTLGDFRLERHGCWP